MKYAFVNLYGTKIQQYVFEKMHFSEYISEKTSQKIRPHKKQTWSVLKSINIVKYKIRAVTDNKLVNFNKL